MGLGEIRRNNLDDVAKWYDAHGPTLTSETYMVLWRLQDDPAAFEEMSTTWTVAAPADA
jgi:hypothetical protein